MALAKSPATSRGFGWDECTEALRAAVDAYCGDLASGADYLWIEPAREDLRRRALDALVRLAESHDSRAVRASGC